MTTYERQARKEELKNNAIKLAAIYGENARIVETQKCPTCGAHLKYNNSLTGWWQCSQSGAEGFRADSSKPSCNFQCFVKYN